MKKIQKIVSAFVITLALVFLTLPLARPVRALDENTITIVHTNDMHGRLNQDSNGYTFLAKMKYYLENNTVDLLVDAGDAIQGLPISNLSKGLNMLEAMHEIGYDAMTIGNHEFDFGMSNIKTLRDANLVPMVSNNVLESGTEVFDRYTVVTKGTTKFGIVGVTTPETATKTHPNNIPDVTFADPLTEVQADITELEALAVDYIIVLAHLGTDLETQDAWRGDKLAESLNTLGLATPIVVIDGHSHTTYPDGVWHGNVLYAQTGEYLNNIGVITIDVDDFANSTARLVGIGTIAPTDGSTTKLNAEIEAQANYDLVAGEVITTNLPVDFNGDRAIQRTQETALGNLITDAMLSYGKGFSQVPDLAVINGGGIRANLDSGEVTLGDIIAVLPFGNSYSSIEVTGAQILEMFEYALRTDIQLNGSEYQTNPNGTYLLGQNGGFLQVAGAVVTYNVFKPAGSRIESILFDTPTGLQPLDPSRTYILATNDFLAAGGDGYTMLGGPRIEGASLDTVLAEFLRDRFDFIDWTEYEEQTPLTRVLQIAVEAEAMDELESLVANAQAIIDDSTNDYSDETIAALNEVLEEAIAYLEDINSFTQDDHEDLISRLSAAIESLIKDEIPDLPGDGDDNDNDNGETDNGGKLPDTGVYNVIYPAMGLVGIGLVTVLVSKRKEN